MPSPPGEYDSASGGPPCTPRTVFRSNKSALAASAHKDFGAIFADKDSEIGSYLGTIEVHRPRGGYLEEVFGFGIAAREADESHLENAVARLRAIPFEIGIDVAICGSLYKSVQVVTVKPGVWTKLARPRRLARHEFQIK